MVYHSRIKRVSLRIYARVLSLFLILFLFSSWSCAPDIAREEKRWKRSELRLKRQRSRYPLYRKFLNAKLSTARKARKLARKIKDQEKKAEALARANRTINDDLVRGLVQYETLRDKIRRKRNELAGMRIAASERDRVRTEVRNALKVLAETRRDLNHRESTNAEETAVIALASINQRLESASGDLERLIKTLRALEME